MEFFSQVLLNTLNSFARLDCGARVGANSDCISNVLFHTGAVASLFFEWLELGNLNDIRKTEKISVSVDFCITRVVRSQYAVSKSLVAQQKKIRKAAVPVGRGIFDM